MGMELKIASTTAIYDKILRLRLSSLGQVCSWARLMLYRGANSGWRNFGVVCSDVCVINEVCCALFSRILAYYRDQKYTTDLFEKQPIAK